MTSKEYVRIDLWRYLHVKDEDIRGTFKFIKFIVNYVYILILIFFIVAAMLLNISGKSNVMNNFLVGILIMFEVRNNTIGDIVLYICSVTWRIKYNPPEGEHLELYNTKKSKRHIKTRYHVLYWVILFVLSWIVGNMAYADRYLVSNEVTVIFWILFYIWMGWINHDHIFRRLNLRFGE